MSWTIHTGDCIEEMAQLPESSVDAVVCDPPYGINFMGQSWDGAAIENAMLIRAAQKQSVHKDGSERRNPRMSLAEAAGKYDLSLNANRRYQAWCELWAWECFRLLKPGGHLLASCGSRTYQRMACGIEDAGFEIRDSIMWLYGSGFPKSLNVSKAIDKAAGAERDVVGQYRMPADSDAGNAGKVIRSVDADSMFGVTAGREGTDITASSTSDAQRWDGWGTALKPAHEPIVVARKPLVGTVAANVLEHGTGALNMDGCRIGTGAGGERDGEASAERRYTENGSTNFAPTPGPRGDDALGRWPANVVLDPEAAEALDLQSGLLQSGLIRAGSKREGIGYHGGLGNTVASDSYGDSGGASRFFYCAKTSRAERNAGLEDFPDVEGGFRSETSGQHLTRRDGGDPGPTKNNHPTVKPINLMRWLVRLITPPGGTVLDPFTGSGSTGCAAVLEGFDFIGCEREPEYVSIAEARIAFWARHVGREVEDVLRLNATSTKDRDRHTGAGQEALDLGATHAH